MVGAEPSRNCLARYRRNISKLNLSASACRGLSARVANRRLTESYPRPGRSRSRAACWAASFKRVEDAGRRRFPGLELTRERNSFHDVCRDSSCSRRRCWRAAASEKKNIRNLDAQGRFRPFGHGSSFRNRIDVSNVAARPTSPARRSSGVPAGVEPARICSMS